MGKKQSHLHFVEGTRVGDWTPEQKPDVTPQGRVLSSGWVQTEMYSQIHALNQADAGLDLNMSSLLHSTLHYY